MPRVYTRTARGSKKVRRCTGCGKDIEPGQTFYTWSRRFGYGGATYFRHTECGRPRPTELSSRKTAQIEEAIQAADFAFSETLPDDFSPDDSYEVDLGYIEGVLGDIADVAESVADEYEESAENMPESLQYSAQCEAMREVAENLREWADTLRDFQPDTDVEFPDPEEDDDGEIDLDLWREVAQGALTETCDRIASEAEELTYDMPEYEG